jgi:hypothetical protein
MCSLKNDLKRTTLELFKYCFSQDWAGHDPYDALNSRLIEHLPIMNSRFPRLVITQLMKRSPINFRPLIFVPKTQNPKAISLFLMALLKLSKLNLIEEEFLIESMVERLKTLKAIDTPHWVWGYSFPWQTRTILVPRGYPNLVCTVFVANSLLDMYDRKKDPDCLAMAVDASEYILRDLYWAQNDFMAGFAYPLPSYRNHIYNANFLGAALLSRIYAITGNKRFMGPALKVARYSAAKQNSDGSWYYGESPTQYWIDNFHTGYNLIALVDIKKYCATDEFDLHIQRGYEFYQKHFFRDD